MELTEAIDFIEDSESISLSGIQQALNQVKQKNSDLNNIQYQALKNYLGEIDKAIEERRENSFANRVGVLEKLKSLYDFK